MRNVESIGIISVCSRVDPSRRSRCDSFVKDTTVDDDQPQRVTELASGGVFIFALQLVNRAKHSSYIRGHHCQK